MLKWPGYRVNARIEPGMSGGPVLNRKGQLCGLLCSSFSGLAGDGDAVGYVTTLWPLLMLTLPESFFPHLKGSVPTHRAVIDLVLHSRIWVDDLNQFDPRLFPGRELAVSELVKKQLPAAGIVAFGSGARLS